MRRWAVPVLGCILAVVARRAEAQATPPAAVAAPVAVRAAAEPDTVTIGTPFRYTVEIVAPKEVELVIPLLGERIGDFFVSDFGEDPPRQTPEGVVARRWFKLVAYSPGEKLVPPYPIKYRLPGEEMRDAAAEEVLVSVESVIAKHAPDQEPASLDIRDIAPPVEVPWNWRPAAVVGGASLALLALGAGLYFGLNRRRAAAGPPALPPHEIAYEALRRLRGRKLIEAGEHERYYVELTAIVRVYTENRFGLRAPEMTTEEFLAAAQRDRRLTNEHRTLLADFLTESDLVKFARYTPAAEDAERATNAARRFVDESRLGPAAEEVDRAAA